MPVDKVCRSNSLVLKCEDISSSFRADIDESSLGSTHMIFSNLPTHAVPPHKAVTPVKTMTAPYCEP